MICACQPLYPNIFVSQGDAGDAGLLLRWGMFGQYDDVKR